MLHLGRAGVLGAALAEEDLRQLYGVLVVLTRGHVSEIRAAYQATVFAGDVFGEREWERFEAPLEWPIVGESQYKRLLEGKGDSPPP